MNTQVGARDQLVPESSPAARPEVVVTRPFYWAVRRELWEHKALYIAPGVVIAVLLLIFLVNGAQFASHATRIMIDAQPSQLRSFLSVFQFACAAIMTLVMGVVAWIYCLDAMQGERRDRSILFWKSLPVSDLTTVLAKLFVPSAVIPLITFMAVIGLQLLLMILASVAIVVAGGNPLILWAGPTLFDFTVILLYTLIVLAVWYAPLYAWLLLVSAWARRWALLWAALPPFALALFESAVFGTSYISDTLSDSLPRGFGLAFHIQALPFSVAITNLKNGITAGASADLPEHLGQMLDPVGFFTSASVWGGLAVAAIFVAGAVWVRRYREPL